jgi:hypothetical protein
MRIGWHDLLYALRAPLLATEAHPTGTAKAGGDSGDCVASELRAARRPSRCLEVKGNGCHNSRASRPR